MAKLNIKFRKSSMGKGANNIEIKYSLNGTNPFNEAVLFNASKMEYNPFSSLTNLIFFRNVVPGRRNEMNMNLFYIQNNPSENTFMQVQNGWVNNTVNNNYMPAPTYNLISKFFDKYSDISCQMGADLDASTLKRFVEAFKDEVSEIYQNVSDIKNMTDEMSVILKDECDKICWEIVTSSKSVYKSVTVPNFGTKLFVYPHILNEKKFIERCEKLFNDFFEVVVIITEGVDERGQSSLSDKDRREIFSSITEAFEQCFPK